MRETCLVVDVIIADQFRLCVSAKTLYVKHGVIVGGFGVKLPGATGWELKSNGDVRTFGLLFTAALVAVAATRLAI